MPFPQPPTSKTPPTPSLMSSTMQRRGNLLGREKPTVRGARSVTICSRGFLHTPFLLSRSDIPQLCYNASIGASVVRGLLGTGPPDPTLESASPSPPQGSIWHRFNIDSTLIRYRCPDLTLFQCRINVESMLIRKIRAPIKIKSALPPPPPKPKIPPPP